MLDRAEVAELAEIEHHRCIIEDVKTRVFVSQIYAIFVFLAILFAVVEIFKGDSIQFRQVINFQFIYYRSESMQSRNQNFGAMPLD
jgi:hypothetical protein